MVLLYHAVLPPPSDADEIERSLFVDPDRFAEQMHDLHARGFTTLTLAEFRAALVGQKGLSKRLLITFDDAYAHVAAIVTPVLRQFGFSAVMFAAWQHLGQTNSWDSGHRNLSRLEIASIEELRAMHDQGWEVASHGFRHVQLAGVSAGRRRSELRESRRRLGDLLGEPVVDLAYPYGVCNLDIRSDAEAAGFQTAFLAEPSRHFHPLAVPRRPIRGDDSMAVFRLKTSLTGAAVSHLNEFTPAWAKLVARRIIH
jgi:peptidoglycan/xylan/chitin deacetylase (PgdA/CDA1 family)